LGETLNLKNQRAISEVKQSRARNRLPILKVECSVHEVCALFKFSEVRAVCKQRDPARVLGNHPDTKSGMVFPSAISTPISACSLSMSSVYAAIMSESCFFLNEFMSCLICV
jgi:hypothetical protein